MSTMTSKIAKEINRRLEILYDKFGPEKYIVALDAPSFCEQNWPAERIMNFFEEITGVPYFQEISRWSQQKYPFLKFKMQNSYFCGTKTRRNTFRRDTSILMFVDYRYYMKIYTNIFSKNKVITFLNPINYQKEVDIEKIL